MAADLAYTSPQHVRDLLTKQANVAIYDVRGDDFVGGHLKAAKNVPISTFVTSIPQIVDEVKGKDEVIVHCMQSQLRAVKAARALQAGLDASAKGSAPQVKIMEGGFSRWVHDFGDSDEVADYDVQLWGARS